jgi:hypothetical protein
MDEFRVFKDALIYTVCSQIVTIWLDTSNTVSLIFLILIFSVLVFIVMKLNTVVRTQGAAYLAPTPLNFATFAVATVLNLVLQFQSNLVAQLAIDTLSPQTASPDHIATFAILSIVLIWLMAESIKT